MAGIMLPSLLKSTETKAHKSSAKNPHQGKNFAEFMKAQSPKTQEARKNNQPARTAQAEGPKQEKRSDRSPHNAASNPLVLVAPFCMTLQTPSPQVLGGRHSVVAAASETDVHPKTSSAILASPGATGKSMRANKPEQDSKQVNNKAKTESLTPKVKESIQQAQIQQAQIQPEARSAKPAVETTSKTQGTNSNFMPNQVDVAHTRSTQFSLQIQAPSAPAPTHQVAGLIVHAAKDGISKAEMVLHPEGLGTVQVNLAMDSNGVLQATVVADPAAIQALSQDLDNLVQALQSAGIQMGDLQLQARDQQNPGQDSQQTPGMQQIGITNGADGDLGLLPIYNLQLTALIQGGAKLDLFI